MEPTVTPRVARQCGADEQIKFISIVVSKETVRGKVIASAANPFRLELINIYDMARPRYPEVPLVVRVSEPEIESRFLHRNDAVTYRPTAVVFVSKSWNDFLLLPLLLFSRPMAWRSAVRVPPY